ncbi:AraC family transcriptional regulator [Desulfovibrio litoralis]|uniref:Helix-turn-helix domain-containing protein n=1 Tax=Desulfovibrio litoralis DSM 11393 TaxID=1121455 RepID=A0A1M7TLU6_9BACT|nr:AraC family transcriptional regulator [Desulfovibrio litoralis]SHN71618.1 Helix-turn-helix domain-containing protein [Desulfovibrio litoralis DSM 11393]
MSTDKQIKLEILRTNLEKKILQHCTEIGKQNTKIDGLMISRQENKGTLENCFYTPTVGVIIQGCKYSRIGNDEYNYGALHCMVAGVDMPSLYRLTEASPEKPFLAISLGLDRYLIAQLIAEMQPSSTFYSVKKSFKGVVVAKVELEILDAFSRLIDLIDYPDQIPVIAPLIKRELHYRLLLGFHGEWLREINTLGTQSNQIAKAISWLRKNYREPLLVENLAEQVNMAPSTFHRHFRQVTTLSPIQFQKRLRLYEAQRLMLTSSLDASSAAMTVGYESISQFNREYKRLFGEPPFRNILHLRDK